MTKRETFEGILAVLAESGTDKQVAFIEKEIATLEKRASAERKPTASQLEGEVLKGAMVTVLADTEGMTATDLGTAVGISVQRASQLLKQLVTAGTVTRVEGKGKTKTVFTV